MYLCMFSASGCKILKGYLSRKACVVKIKISELKCDSSLRGSYLTNIARLQIGNKGTNYNTEFTIFSAFDFIHR
jgi:hypothetical protein